MKCNNCGADLLKNDKYCKKCGAETPFLVKLDTHLAVMMAIPLIYLLLIIYVLMYKNGLSVVFAINGGGLLIEIDGLIYLLRHKHKKKQAIITFFISLIMFIITFFIAH